MHHPLSLTGDEDLLTILTNASTVLASFMAIFGLSGGILGLFNDKQEDRSKPLDAHIRTERRDESDGYLWLRMKSSVPIHQTKTASFAAAGALVGAGFALLMFLLLALIQFL